MTVVSLKFHLRDVECNYKISHYREKGLFHDMNKSNNITK